MLVWAGAIRGQG